MNLNSIMQQLQAEQQQAATKTRALDAAGNAGASGGASASGGAGDPATITADDFLTLLVTELQNQDPTANTDPNEYVNQLVNVNSLQQLISINQEVGDLTPSTPATGSSVASAYALNPTATAASRGPSAAEAASGLGTPAQPGAAQSLDPAAPAVASGVSRPAVANSALANLWLRANAGH